MEERLDFLPVPAAAEHMMVLDGVGQEIGKVTEPYPDLRSAQHIAEGRVFHRSFLNEIAGKIAGAFEQGAITCFKFPLNRNANS